MNLGIKQTEVNMDALHGTRTNLQKGENTLPNHWHKLCSKITQVNASKCFVRNIFNEIG